MASEADVMLEEPASIPLPASPRISITNVVPVTNSMVSVRLSDPALSTSRGDDGETTSTASDVTVEPVVNANRRSSTEIMGGVDLDTEINAASIGEREEELSIRPQFESKNERALSALVGDEIKDDLARRSTSRRRSSSSADSSCSDSPVDWPTLDRTEESEPRDCGSDEVGSRYRSCR